MSVKPSRSLADPALTELLTDLLSEEALPALDRWFSTRARRLGWSVPQQKRLWDALRRALTRGYDLADGATPEASRWEGFRRAMLSRAQEWALRAELPAGEPSLGTAGIPGWLGPAVRERARLSGWSAEETGQFLGLQDAAPPVHVRFRPDAEGQECARRLAAAGVTTPSDVETIVRLAGGAGLEGSPDWKAGLVEIQDASSQLSLNRLGLRPGMRVWDVCAGQGGKTLLAARELRGKGALLATDVTETKLKALKDRVRRSGWQNIRLQTWDGEVLPDFGPELSARGGFDRVIVDAPCTASGTWRRDPEARYRLTPRVIDEVIKHQHRLIRLGWSALKSGGQLAYITCSWLPQENEAIVHAFCEENRAEVVHQEVLGLPWFDANTLFVCILEKP